MLKKLKMEQNKLLQTAYDEGYEKAKKEYEPEKTYWITITGRPFLQYRCKVCGEDTIASYDYCPNCGRVVGGRK